MLDINIFDCQDYSTFIGRLRKVIDGSKDLNARQLSFKIGLKSSTPLCMALTGKRILSRSIARRIGEELKMQALQINYMELLIEKEVAKTRNLPTEKLDKNLDVLRANSSDQKILDNDKFAFISAWYHLVILELVGAQSFREDLAWIQKKLRYKVSKEQIESAINRMLSLEILSRDKNGKLIESKSGIANKGGTPVQAVREHHKQMMTRAIESLEEQTIDRRDISSMTVQFDFTRMNEAKTELDEFREYFRKKYYAPKSDQVYQLNLQFFEHTQEEGTL